MATDIRIKEQLPELTDRLVKTYTEVSSINHLDHCPLPNYDTIIEATADLKEILYPGYRRREGLHMANVAYHVGDLVDRLHDTLTLADRPGAVPRRGQPTDACDAAAARRFRSPGPGPHGRLPGATAGAAESAGHGRRGRLRRRPGLQIAG